MQISVKNGLFHLENKPFLHEYNKIRLLRDGSWCRRRDLNPHGFYPNGF